MPKALIAMSGGVDSSLAAKLMLDNGYSCIGCTMKLYHNDDLVSDHTHTCCSLSDVEDARSVAYSLNMPFYVFNFTDTFQQKVIQKFINNYESGITPNPCIDCNRYLKFDTLYERAKLLECDVLVTGHYARIEEQNGQFLLKKALDETKDQSYVLYFLTQEQLAHTKFPLGTLRKTQVRSLAEQQQFRNAQKPDSQDICFIPHGNYVEFLEHHAGHPYPAGDFVDTKGNVLGQHKGTVCYTIGQRKGLGLSLPEPMYVKQIDSKNNQVVLCKTEELGSTQVTVTDFHWISGTAPQSPIRCKAKIRYRHPEQWATVIPSTSTDTVQIFFDQPQRAVTPGQAAVLYDGDLVLGGGTILSSSTAPF